MRALVFRGLGLGISKGELAAYEKRVVVFFQKCAYGGTKMYLWCGLSAGTTRAC